MLDTTTILTSLAVGLVVVPVVSYLKKEHWDNRLKVAIAMLVSLLFSTGQLFAVGTVHSWHDIVAGSSVVFAASTAFYKLYFSGSPFETPTIANDINLANTILNPPAQPLVLPPSTQQ